MSKYRNNLPQLSDRLFLTDGGLETTLIFHEGVELPYFASFDLMKSKSGIAKIRAYYERYIAMAKENGLGFVLEVAHLARQSGLGGEARLFARAAGGRQPRRDRADGGSAPPA